MFSARCRLCAVDWEKSEVAMAYSNAMLQNFASIGQEEKFQVTICNLQFENESRSLPQMTQDHDFRLLSMSNCLFNDTVCSSGIRCRKVGLSLKKQLEKIREISSRSLI